MAKSKFNSAMEMALAATKRNIVKARGASGKKTYLDRFVDCLLDEEGNPVEPKDRIAVIAEISYSICTDKRKEDQATDSTLPDFTLTAEGDTEDDAEFLIVNEKVKAQVAAAIANNNNSTSVSFNDKYKNDWHVVKTGNLVSLAEGPDEELVASRAAQE